jgi:cobalt transporter subunit CbtB
MQESIAIPAAQPLTMAARLPALAVLGFGLVVLFAVGFAEATPVHNTTHDTRHANGFPCH